MHKYIVFRDSDNVESVYMFPIEIEHKFFASQLKLPNGSVPVRAGFVKIRKNGEVFCMGESISLELESNPALDQQLIVDQGRKSKEWESLTHAEQFRQQQ